MCYSTKVWRKSQWKCVIAQKLGEKGCVYVFWGGGAQGLWGMVMGWVWGSPLEMGGNPSRANLISLLAMEEGSNFGKIDDVETLSLEESFSTLFSPLKIYG